MFRGDGGPSPVDAVAGPWCCRLGGTDTPTARHLSDGLCLGLLRKPLDDDDDYDDAAADPADVKLRQNEVSPSATAADDK